MTGTISPALLLLCALKACVRWLDGDDAAGRSFLLLSSQRRVLMSRSNKFSGGDVAGGPPSAGGSPTAAVSASSGRAPSGRAPSRLNLTVSASSPPGPGFVHTGALGGSGGGSGGGPSAVGAGCFMAGDVAIAAAAAVVTAAALPTLPYSHSQPQLVMNMSAVAGGASQLQSGPAMSPLPSCSISSGTYPDVAMAAGSMMSDGPSVCAGGGGALSGSGTTSGGDASGQSSGGEDDAMEIERMAGAGATVDV